MLIDNILDHIDQISSHQTNESNLGKELYLYVRDILSSHKQELSSAEKITILKKYIKTWNESPCRLHINDTEYADLYAASMFEGYHDYPSHVPMLAGFDLENVVFSKIDKISYPHPNLIFLSNNLRNADFSGTDLSGYHFENCDLSGIQTNQRYLNNCQFVKCNLRDADLQGTSLYSVWLKKCDITNIKLKKTDDYTHRALIMQCYDDKVVNKNQTSLEINQQVEAIENQHTGVPIVLSSSAYLTTKMKQLINVFVPEQEKNLTLSLMTAVEKIQTTHIDETDKKLIDDWLDTKLKTITSLSPDNAIDVLRHILNDPDINAIKATSSCIKSLSAILVSPVPQKELHLTKTDKSDLNRYIRSILNHAILKIFINTNILDIALTKKKEDISLDYVISLLNKMIKAINSFREDSDGYVNSFGDDKSAALKMLVLKKNISPKDAIMEILHLDEEQAKALVQLYDHGLRSKHLLTFMPYNQKDLYDIYFDYPHIKLLSHLIKNKYLTPSEAMAEIMGLNEYQVESLAELYELGLRGAHLRQWHRDFGRFNGAQTDALKYLMAKQQLTPDQAIAEINDLVGDQLDLLITLYSNGLRGEHLRHLQVFNLTKKNALIKLIIDNHVPIDIAIAQLNQLGETPRADATLANLYSFGLRSETLIKNWGSPTSFSNEDDTALVYLVTKEHLTPEQAINEIKGLPTTAVEALTELYSYGLRRSHVSYWGQDHTYRNVNRWHALVVLICGRGKNIDEACTMLNSLEKNASLDEVANEYTPDMSTKRTPLAMSM